MPTEEPALSTFITLIDTIPNIVFLQPAPDILLKRLKPFSVKVVNGFHITLRKAKSVELPCTNLSNSDIVSYSFSETESGSPIGIPFSQDMLSKNLQLIRLPMKDHNFFNEDKPYTVLMVMPFHETSGSLLLYQALHLGWRIVLPARANTITSEQISTHKPTVIAIPAAFAERR